MTTDTSRPSLEAELQQLTHGALSPLARHSHVGLLLAATLMSVLIGALLVTEVGLPGRTQIALTVLLAIGLSWIAYAIWTLRQRHPLLGQHRVIAGRMAVGFTAVFFLGASLLSVTTGNPTMRLAAIVGAGLLLLAIGVLMHAWRRVAELERQRQELEQRLSTSR